MCIKIPEQCQVCHPLKHFKHFPYTTRLQTYMYHCIYEKKKKLYIFIAPPRVCEFFIKTFCTKTSQICACTMRPFVLLALNSDWINLNMPKYMNFRVQIHFLYKLSREHRCGLWKREKETDLVISCNITATLGSAGETKSTRVSQC